MNVRHKSNRCIKVLGLDVARSRRSANIVKGESMTSRAG